MFLSTFLLTWSEAGGDGRRDWAEPGEKVLEQVMPSPALSYKTNVDWEMRETELDRTLSLEFMLEIKCLFV